MRLAFPIKVFLSYLLIVLVGTLPTYIFLQKQFRRSWFSHEAKRLASQAQRLAKYLGEYSQQHRLVELRNISQTLNERVTYINKQGVVLYDSYVNDVTKVTNHATRHEIRLLRNEKVARMPFDPKVAGISVARRRSQTLKIDTLYVAIRLTSRPGEKGDILRLAVPVEQFKNLVETLLRVFRNSQAGALSVALFLSLLAAIVFMRPLQRILKVANHLAAGDYIVSVGKMGRDEIGDVGRAIDRLALKLRERLTIAEADEVLLVQLLRLVPPPLVVFDIDRKVLGLNRAARYLFETRREGAEENLARWCATTHYQESLLRADEIGDGQSVIIPLPEDEREIPGLLYALKHPTSEPLGALLVDVKELGPSFLPRPSDVVVVPLSELVDRAMQRASTTLQNASIQLQQPAEWPSSVVLADAQERSSLALALLIEGAVLHHSRQEQLVLDYEDKGDYVAIILRSRTAPFVEAMVRLCVEPLGGSLNWEAGECLLTLPKA